MDRNLAYLNPAELPLQGAGWHLADKKICAFLVAANFVECNSSRAITMRLLTPSYAGALLRAALVASLTRGAFSLVEQQAVCLV